jgi:FlaG/FlaF family flagellin (archaellin)
MVARKGVSPMISTILLIGIVVLMAAVIGPWTLNLALQASQNAGNEANQEMICRATSYAFDTDYGSSGVAWSFSETNGTLSVKIINTGTQNLYNFSLELTMQTPTDTKIIVYPEINVTEDSQRTKANPLKPGYDWILDSDVAGINSTWLLTKVKVINDVCPRVSPSVDI